MLKSSHPKPKNHRDSWDIVIDSKDRDVSIYPNPADYVIRLPTVFHRVKYIEFMSLQLTRTEPTVHSGNQQFLYTVNGTDYTITLPMNDYTFGDQDCLVRAVKKALRQVQSTVQVSRTDRMLFQISDQVPFSITVNESTAKLLGLPWSPTLNDPLQTFTATLDAGAGPGTTYTLRGTRMMDLTGIPYLILYINDYTRVISPSNPLNRAYMIIPMESRRYMERFIVSNDEKEKKSRFKLMDQQRTLSQFRIRFTRPDGSLYDFNGMDHHLVFKATEA
jgi:hypothetical protein